MTILLIIFFQVTNGSFRKLELHTIYLVFDLGRKPRINIYQQPFGGMFINVFS
jgi:hypothetical protein